MKIFLLLLIATSASAKLARIEKHGDDRIPGRYFVGFKDDVEFDTALFATESLTENVIMKFKNLNLLVLKDVDEKLLEKVRSLEIVEYVEEDSVVRTQVTWGLDRVDQKSLPLNNRYSAIGNGAGANIYVIDTGINAKHRDFRGRAFEAFDAIKNRKNTAKDCNGHGTHCSGTAASSTYGVAKGANVYGVRVLGCSGSGYNSDVVQGMDWVADNHKPKAVASMSLGGGRSSSTDKAVKDLWKKGVVVSVAAGNDNRNACNYSPAGAQEAITVGATTNSDYRSSYSNYGSCVDIFAPGSSITSTWYTSRSATKTISGTSMACPHVSGAAAIYLAKDLSKTATVNKILNTATRNKIKNTNGSPNLLLYVGK